MYKYSTDTPYKYCTGRLLGPPRELALESEVLGPATKAYGIVTLPDKSSGSESASIAGLGNVCSLGSNCSRQLWWKRESQGFHKRE